MSRRRPCGLARDRDNRPETGTNRMGTLPKNKASYPKDKRLLVEGEDLSLLGKYLLFSGLFGK